jgi:hypothetical protein
MRIARPSEAVAPYVPESPAQAPEAVAHPPTAAFGRLLHGLGQELDRGEALAERAIHGGAAGGGMSPQALIALQAGIYRYSEAVDLVTKLVDRGTQAVKTTLQNQ